MKTATRQTATVRVEENAQDSRTGNILYAGTYRIELPADYDPALVTGVDILCDDQIHVLGEV